MLAVYGAGRGEDDFVSLLCQDFWQISQNSGHLFCLQLSLSQWPELVFKHNNFSPKSWWGLPFSSKRMNVTRAKNMLQCLHTFTFTMTGNCLQREVACPLCEFETNILIHWSMCEGLKSNPSHINQRMRMSVSILGCVLPRSPCELLKVNPTRPENCS